MNSDEKNNGDSKLGGQDENGGKSQMETEQMMTGLNGASPSENNSSIPAVAGEETTKKAQEERPEKEPKRKGRKPRSQRNRKRPRSELYSNDNLKIESTIVRLEMNGKPILEAGGSEQFIRVIHPYPYTFSTFAKKRWIGRTLLNVYQSEFGSYPEVCRFVIIY
jgi:hypothetical protein